MARSRPDPQVGPSGVENKIPWVGSRGLQLSRDGSDHPDPVRPAISDPPVNRPALFIPKQFKPPLPPSRTDKARPPHVYYSRYAYEPRYDSEREPCARAHTLRGVNVSTSRHQNKPRHQKYPNLRVLRWSYHLCMFLRIIGITSTALGGGFLGRPALWQA